MIILLNTLFSVAILAESFCVYLLYRNEKVFQFRTNEIYRDLDAYEKLPSHNTMLFRFWVWPLTKFRK